MKKFYLFFIFACCCLNSLAQATSLTVECQTPGWLSSYINPSDIPTLQNLTVKGEINATDLATIGYMVKNYSLQGHLDISDVTIAENRINGDMFGVLGCHLNYFALPKSIRKMEKCIEWVTIDTLVCGTVENPDFRIGYSPADGNFTDYCSSLSSFKVKHLVLREGIESFKAFCQVPGSSTILKNDFLESIHFPMGMKHLSYFYNLQKLSEMNIPEGVETLGIRLHTNIHMPNDTLFIPSSVKTFYDTWAGYDYRNAYVTSNTRNAEGRIKCLYLPDNLETFWVDALIDGTEVDIHIKAPNPPKIENGLFNSNTIVYVPVGYKEVYMASGKKISESKYTQWSGATILEEVYAESININVSPIMYKDEIYKLKADVLPQNTTFKDVTWISSDNSILSISENGNCLTSNYGEVSITAMTADRSCSASTVVKVCVHTTGISISDTNLSMRLSETKTIQASTLPLDISDGRVKWESTDDNVASVDENGKIKAVGHGTCIITVTSVDGGFTATCEVTVLQPVEAATLETHGMEMKVGDNKDLYCNLQPATADNKAIVWQSSDENIATVDNSGSVTALKAGTVYIRAISEDNPEAKDSCKVTVLQPVKGITLNYSTYEVNAIGESFVLEATISPEDASNKEIKWTSSDESVCIVSNGTVVVTGFGTCVIIASTNDGNYIATCTINSVPTGIKTINSKDASFDVYDINGGSQKSIRKGLNIIRMSDGTVKKVVVK